MQLKGKVALVTGAASTRSIGWGIARALADEGADVAVSDVHHTEALKSRAEDLRTLGRRSVALAGDVTQANEMVSVVAQTVEHLGQLDIVVNSAGVVYWESLLDLTIEKLRAMVSVNLIGTTNVCRAAAQQMMMQGRGGKIILVSSVQADAPSHFNPVYSATKQAMHVFVGNLALELAPHAITINHIGPGWVQTALNDKEPRLQTLDDIELQRQFVPLKRSADPYEVGRAVVFFTSNDGNYITGTGLRIDGGIGIGKAKGPH